MWNMWFSKVFRALLFLSCSLIGWTSQDGTRSSRSWLYKPVLRTRASVRQNARLGSTLNVLAESTLVVCFTEKFFWTVPGAPMTKRKATYCFLQLRLFNTGLWEQLHGKISKVCRSEDVDATSTQSNDPTENKTVSSSMHCIWFEFSIVKLYKDAL